MNVWVLVNWTYATVQLFKSRKELDAVYDKLPDSDRCSIMKKYI